MKVSDYDKYLDLQYDIYEANKIISAMDEPFIEAYDPSVKSFKQSLLSFIESTNASEEKDSDDSIKTGMGTLDSYTGGLGNGELTLISLLVINQKAFVFINYSKEKLPS